MKVEESIYDKQSKTLRKGEWFDPTGFEHKVSLCGKFVTTSDVLTLYAPILKMHQQVEREDEMLTYPCNYFEQEEFIPKSNTHKVIVLDGVSEEASIVLWRST